MNTTHILGAAVALMLAGAPAVAADMPVKAPPPPLPVYNWTGFYLGADIGASFADARATTTAVTGFGIVGPNALVPFARPSPSR